MREKSTHLEVIRMVMDYAWSLGFDLLHLDYSPIKGPEGNIEYLLHIKKRPETEALEAGTERPDVPGLDPAAVVETAHQDLQTEA